MNLTKIISAQPYNELEITFWPTDICNFNCPYCFVGNTTGKYRYPKNFDAVLQTFKDIFSNYKKHKKDKFNINIAGGGEPTMWPDLDRFCQEIKNLDNVNVEIVSNGSRTINWWQKNSAFIDRVILSCHVYEANIEHFINVADTLHENNTEVIAMMLMDAKKWDQCVEYIDKMLTSKHSWYVKAKEIVDSPGHDINSYTIDQLIYMNESTKRFVLPKNISSMNMYKSIGIYEDISMPARTSTYIKNKENYFKGWKCNMPLERLSVDANLTVRGSCHVKFKTIDSVICTKESCTCETDTHITKWKI